MKVTILGAGAYGLALSRMFYENTKDITVWTKFEEEKEMLDKERCHKKVVKDFKIPKEIIFTTDMKEAIKDSSLVVIATPAAFIDSTTKELCTYDNNIPILIASKGIERDTCLFAHDVVKKYIKHNKIAVISGPTFAVDIVSLVPVGLSIASENIETINLVTKLLSNKYLKLRATDDMLGVEICGSIKNVIAIASGIIDGMGLPISTKAMFITESLHDIKELIDALGGKKYTILSFAGFGDLLLTCTSEKSRNFTLGRIIGEGKSKEETDEYMNNTTIEGLYTLKSIYKLLNDKKVSMPIIDLVNDIIYNGKDKEELIKFLIEK